jgi:hypothetical protein
VADGRRVDLPAGSECQGILGWLSPDQLAVPVADPGSVFLQTLYVCDPTVNTARPIAPAAEIRAVSDDAHANANRLNARSSRSRRIWAYARVRSRKP